MPKKLVISLVECDPSVCEGRPDLLALMSFTAKSFRRAFAFRRLSRDERLAKLFLASKQNQQTYTAYTHEEEKADGFLNPAASTVRPA
jgi:hypothetical protein